ncbi:MAG: EF-P lysine aminoacylase GenX [Deltaproteobacteria bacterium]|nr:EF-P lysine aminoacylase GenX [Deltaproteobacteria bacterium]
MGTDPLTGRGVEIVGRDVRAGREPGEVARLRTRGALLRRRAELMAVVRAFFVERGFVEVETPIVVPSPGLDVHLDAMACEGRYLITSPEYQMKRLLAGGMPRIFQIVKCFRRGEIGARHNPEFTMLEWYRAHGTFEELIAETEALVVAVAKAARGAPELVVDGRTVTLNPPFERLPLAAAFARHARMTEEQALSLASLDEERFFRVLVEEVEPALAAGPPVALVDWPTAQASLARKKPGDPRVAERFELMAGGVELCNGFGELVDPREQRARFQADQEERRRRGLPVYPIDERFVAALEEGVPPSAGNALGLDRLITLALGASTIGDVISFPAEWL